MILKKIVKISRELSRFKLLIFLSLFLAKSNFVVVENAKKILQKKPCQQ